LFIWPLSVEQSDNFGHDQPLLLILCTGPVDDQEGVAVSSQGYSETVRLHYLPKARVPVLVHRLVHL